MDTGVAAESEEQRLAREAQAKAMQDQEAKMEAKAKADQEAQGHLHHHHLGLWQNRVSCSTCNLCRRLRTSSCRS
jgi:hypothetical protein